MSTLKAILLYIFGPVEQAVIGYLSSREILQLAVQFGILIAAYTLLYIFGLFSIPTAAIVAMALASISQMLAGRVAAWVHPSPTPTVIVDPTVSATVAVERADAPTEVMSAREFPIAPDTLGRVITTNPPKFSPPPAPVKVAEAGAPNDPQLPPNHFHG